MTEDQDMLLDDGPRTPQEIAEDARQHRRTRICVWIILAGLINFLAYIVLYIYFNGEAVNGTIVEIDGQTRYFLQSDSEVSRAAFIYSGIHSISIWPTVGAIMLSMLTLAKERVASSMRKTIVRGQTIITVFATIISLTVIVITIWFTLQFIDRFKNPADTLPTSPPGHRQ